MSIGIGKNYFEYDVEYLIVSENVILHPRFSAVLSRDTLFLHLSPTIKWVVQINH